MAAPATTATAPTIEEINAMEGDARGIMLNQRCRKGLDVISLRYDQGRPATFMRGQMTAEEKATALAQLHELARYVDATEGQRSEFEESCLRLTAEKVRTTIAWLA